MKIDSVCLFRVPQSVCVQLHVGMALERGRCLRAVSKAVLHSQLVARLNDKLSQQFQQTHKLTLTHTPKTLFRGTLTHKLTVQCHYHGEVIQHHVLTG